MSTAKEAAKGLLARLEKAKRPLDYLRLVGRLVKVIPRLLEELERAEVAARKRHSGISKEDRTCERCQKVFLVYVSQMHSGGAAGRFCSRSCYRGKTCVAE